MWLYSERASTSSGLAGAESPGSGRGFRSRRLAGSRFGYDSKWPSRSVDHISESPCEYSDGVSMSTYPVVDVVVTENADF